MCLLQADIEAMFPTMHRARRACLQSHVRAGFMLTMVFGYCQKFGLQEAYSRWLSVVNTTCKRHSG